MKIYCRLSKNCPIKSFCNEQFIDHDCFKKEIENSSEWPCPKPSDNYCGDWPPLHCGEGISGTSGSSGMVSQT